jgi:hypothetical protein
MNPHGATSQKTAFFIVSAVKTSNPTGSHMFNIIPGMVIFVLIDVEPII